MSKKNIQVKKIWQESERVLGIEWTDDHLSKYDVVDLRRKCPCAKCVDEWTGEQRLLPEDVSESIRPIRIDSVGRYALSINFNDGHATGIYSFQFLRSLN